MEPKKELNQGLQKYQDEQRMATFAKIEKAILTLREACLPINKKSVAEEADVHYNVMKKEHIKEFLLNFPEFNPEINSDSADIKHLEEENEWLKKKVEQLEGKAKEDQQRKKALANQISLLKAENKEILEKYQRLLGAYQKGNERKIKKF